MPSKTLPNPPTNVNVGKRLAKRIDEYLEEAGIARSRSEYIRHLADQALRKEGY